MDTPYFSIIIPVYNVEAYLDRCIESVLRQDFTDYEIILVDDGSKDSSPQLCDEWAAKDERIHVIHKENAGLGMARNSGLDVSTGMYVFFFDSDDYICEGLLRECKKKIDETAADGVFYGLSRLDNKGRTFVIREPNPEEWIVSDSQKIKNELLPAFIGRNPHTGRVYDLITSACCCCLRRDLLEQKQLRFVSERQYICEDIYFYIDLFPHLRKTAILEGAYYCYCQNAGSLTSSYREDRFSRLAWFFCAAKDLADSCGYNGEAQLRLKGSFVANTLGCLKMEAANAARAGLRKAYSNIKRIVQSPALIEAFRVYPPDHLPISWKLVRSFVLQKHYMLLFICLLLQYKRKGV